MNVLGCLRKANDEPGPYPMTTSASIWHNKFNMNVNEAQIKIQHWMEKIKGGGGVIPVGRKKGCEDAASSQEGNRLVFKNT